MQKFKQSQRGLTSLLPASVDDYVPEDHLACFIVEAANRTQIAERLERSGMRWGIAGGQAVLTFRTLVTSGRFDCAWDRIMQARGRNGPANDNRNQIRQPLAA